MSLFLLQFVVLFSLPALVAGASAWFARRSLARPRSYFLVAALLLYVAYGVCMYFLAPKAVGYMVSGIPYPAGAEPVPILAVLEPYSMPLLVFLAIAVPAAFALLRPFKRY